MKRFLLAAAFGAMAYSIALASAATLGVTDSGLGSGTKAVASCDTDGVTTSYTYQYTDGTGYTISGVKISGINRPACDSKGLAVTLTKTDTSGPVSLSGTTGTTGDITLATSGFKAEDIGNVYVAIG
ncbi:MAG: hypothetical protein ACRD0O_08330 [Acidimicrobiia bacterium]